MTPPGMPSNPASISRAVVPSGGAAAGIRASRWLATTALSTSDVRSSRLPTPSSVANHKATMAGNNG
ncbi:hypothetical protein KRR38_18560 [Novosphingobium sp. G106]|uniref:hypothetical protein n=1 Tax=Novosphingobium sp. G106 TaxID=2849500 RepID=UPI001C2DE34E|nr:hypothetical protein [Novosphingobium sp. G106]MBV1689630.1 hypothetical protein [Novosphingobium sp. G106]